MQKSCIKLSIGGQYRELGRGRKREKGEQKARFRYIERKIVEIRERRVHVMQEVML